MPLRSERDRPRHARAAGAPTVPHVLVCEDDDELRQLISSTLLRAGFEVTTARDGRQLVDHVARRQLAGQSPFDLIVSDIRMPGMTGLEALQGLRAADWNIPVLLITAFPSAETEDEARRLGAHAVLAKPFALAELRAVATRLVLI